MNTPQMHDDDVPVNNAPTPRTQSKQDNIAALMSNGKSKRVILVTVLVILAAAVLIIALVASMQKTAKFKPSDASANLPKATTSLENARPGATGTSDSPEYRKMLETADDQRVTGAINDPRATAVPTAALVDLKSQPTTAPQPQPAPPPPTVPLQMASAAPAVTRSQAPVDEKRANEAAKVALAILADGKPQGLQIMLKVSESTKKGQASVAAGNPQEGIPTEPAQSAKRKITLIDAGTIVSARIDTAINTDIPSSTVATILTGPFAGAKIVGKYQRNQEVATTTYTLLSIPGAGITVPVNAIALDAETLEAGNATEVDRKLFLRYGIKPLANAAALVGQAMAKQGTTVINDNSTVTTTDIKGSDIAAIAGGGFAEQMVKDLDNKDLNPTVRVAPRTVIGVFFTTDVVYDPKNVNQPTQTAPNPVMPAAPAPQPRAIPAPMPASMSAPMPG